MNQHPALAYQAAGLAIIPIVRRSKKPLVPWTSYQQTAPTRAQVIEWLTTFAGCNWSIILGPVSGNLVVVDFDEAAAYDQWRARFPSIAHLAPTVATARGVHVYLTMPAAPRSARLRDVTGDFKSAGGLCTLPPSIHPSGAFYRWLQGNITHGAPNVSSLVEIGITLQTPAYQEPAPGQHPAGRPFDTRRTPHELKPCAARVLTNTMPSGARNHTAWRLALHLRSDGWSEPGALALMTDWAQRSGTPRAELAATVRSAYRDQRQPGHGCRSAELSPFCDPLCPLAAYLYGRKP